MGGLVRLLVGALLLACAVPGQASGRVAIDIPAGPLGRSITILSDQADISIALSDPALALRSAPAVRGRMTARQALVRLLENAAARPTLVGDRAWRITPAVRQRAPIPAPAPARALAPAPTVVPIEPIVVTGSKRDLLLSNYPGTASVLIGDALNIGVPGRGTEAIVERFATVSSTHSGPGRNKLFIRGIADSSFLGPTQATVGQYLGDMRLNYNASDPNLRLYDIERVEVLEGPQGTLYGAGALGGIIRIVRNPPELDVLALEGSAGVSLTEHGDPSIDGGGMVNIPLAPGRAGLRLIGYGALDGGYIDDLGRDREDVNRVTTYGGRASLRLAPAEGWTMDIGGVFQTIDGRDSQYADRGAPPLTRTSAIAQGYSNDFFMGDVVISHDWDEMRFTSSTGIVHQRLEERFDATRIGGTPMTFDQERRILLVSTENRLASRLHDGFGWVVGASLLHNRVRTERLFGPARGPMDATGVRNAINEGTLFAEISFQPVDRLTVIAGGRFSHARLNGKGLNVQAPASALTDPGERSETSVLPSVAAMFELSSESTLVFRAQQGFRPGGLVVRDDFIQRIENDRVTTLEFGVRHGSRESGRFDIAATVAYSRWTDIQADIVDFSGFPTTANIGDGRIYTFDARAGWRPIDGLAFEAGFFVNNSKVDEPVSGIVLARTDRLPNVADVGAQLSFHYTRPLSERLTLNLSGTARYDGDSRLGIGPILGEPQGDVAEADLYARIGTERYGVSLGIANLFDTVGNRFAVGTPFALPFRRQVTPLRPRTVRLGFDARF
ncbi:MAG: TonB-dependent receptor [Parasphingopyxis sp.]|uniref:TonB-dependent receptor n=1 Tax=Parasphingopyxis sp. TaxID=1920299 RepID=UPI003FA17EF5